MSSLEQRIEGLELEIGRLKETLEEYRSLFRRLDVFSSLGRMPGLQLAEVSGEGAAGEPAAIDAEGRVKVKVEWSSGGENTLAARVVLPWLMAGGGMEFLPRVGQRVWLSFDGGTVEYPLVVGYLPSKDNALPYAQQQSAGAGTLAKTKDKEGHVHNPATNNKYKSVIRSGSPGQSSKFSELAFVDEPEEEGLSLATEGEMRIYSAGEHFHTVDEDSTEYIGGKRHEVVGEDKEEHVKGEYNLVVDKDFVTKVGNGKYERKVEVGSGDVNETIAGKFEQDVKGSYWRRWDGQEVKNFVHVNETSQYWGSKSEIMLGNVNEVTVGQTNDVKATITNEASIQTFGVYVARQDFGISEVSNKVFEVNNKVSEIEHGLAKLKNNLSYLSSDVAELKDATVGLGDMKVALESVLSKVHTGLQVNF